MSGKYIEKATQLLSAWHQRYMGSVDFLYIVAVGIGLLTGIGAALLKGGVDYVTHLFFHSFDVHRGNVAFLILPVIGILVAVVITKYVVKHPLEHGSDLVMEGMAKGENRMSSRLIWGPIVGCSITLGMGGSAGAEDPIAYTGAAIGSNVGKAFKLSQDDLAQLVGCGAAAGIAGIFMAPIGGVMFALEVLKMKQSLKTILAIILASLTAALTCYILLGCHTDVTFMPEMRFENALIPYVLLCGVVCGLYSVYYSMVLARVRRFLKARLTNIWLRALVGGLFVAVSVFLFPSLYGEGYSTIGKLMVDDPISIVTFSPLYKYGFDYLPLMGLIAALLLIKPFATVATNDTGGVGGDFTPTFFCGAVLGFLFAALLNHFFHLHLTYSLFAFFGMAAVMAGAIRAPLMAIFIAAEMTGLYGFILPLTISALTSYIATLAISKVRVPLPFLHRS